MASIAAPDRALLSERRFFLWMSVAIAAAAVAGFDLNFALGRAHVATLPVQARLHGMVFGGWVLLYVVQNLLVDRGAIALHRRLGWLSAGLSMLMVPLGILTTLMAVRRGAVPFFFPVNIFLVINIIGMILFGGLVAAAIALRGRPDWHRRLMLSAAVILVAPAFGRLLPMPLLGPWGPFAIFLSMLAYVAAGMAFDLAIHRRVLRAWWVGAGALAAMHLATGPIAFSPPVRAWAAWLAGA